VHAERKALKLDPEGTMTAFDFVKEDDHALKRQGRICKCNRSDNHVLTKSIGIRHAIMDGDIDKALEYTQAHYPNVLKDNEHIYFRLRSRKFIEMIRRASEIRTTAMKIPKKSNGHANHWYEEEAAQEMELDEPMEQTNGYDKMDVEDSSNSATEYDRLLEATIRYGQVLQAEFKNDPRREVQKSLDDAFALLAYEDPINAKEVSHLVRQEGRVVVAEELNSAILGGSLIARSALM
jgi:hypothetical protein